MGETADRYRRLAARFADRIGEVPPDRWASPSPCEGWTALDVVKHVVETQGRFLSLVGRPPGDVPPVEADPRASWEAASAAVQADLDDPERAATTFESFFGESTFEDAVDRFVDFDLVVHAWDLARATGGDERIDDSDVLRVVAGTEGFGEALRSPGVCGPALEAPYGADSQTQMLALLGREV